MSTIVIAVISQKGGSGKSTLSMNLASSAHQRGLKVAIADTDPQQSVYLWYEGRAAKHPLPLAKSLFASGIPSFVDKCRTNGIDLIVIDTSPNSTEELIAIAEVADLVLVPTAPSLLDIRALRRTFNVIRAVNKPALIVLNRTLPRGARIRQAQQAITAGFGLQVASTRISQSMATQDAYTAGATIHEFEPLGLSAAEFDSLFREICAHPAIDMPLSTARPRPLKKQTLTTKKAAAHV